ncbi:helix-turn-helix domain-containing protein [Paucilactobacillus sp. N302-9]
MLETDELLTRKRVADEILHVSPNTADKEYLYEKGFPYIQEGKRRKYLKSSVIEWLKQNQKYS